MRIGRSYKDRVFKNNLERIIISNATCSKSSSRVGFLFKVSLDLEARSKMEVFKVKKKLESDIHEIELALDHANR